MSSLFANKFMISSINRINNKFIVSKIKFISEKISE